MAILIKDLPESVVLDRQAMLAITGGGGAHGRRTVLGRASFRSARLIACPTGFARDRLPDAKGRSPGTTPLK